MPSPPLLVDDLEHAPEGAAHRAELLGVDLEDPAEEHDEALRRFGRNRSPRVPRTLLSALHELAASPIRQAFRTIRLPLRRHPLLDRAHSLQGPGSFVLAIDVVDAFDQLHAPSSDRRATIAQNTSRRQDGVEAVAKIVQQRNDTIVGERIFAKRMRRHGVLNKCEGRFANRGWSDTKGGKMERISGFLNLCLAGANASIRPPDDVFDRLIDELRDQPPIGVDLERRVQARLDGEAGDEGAGERMNRAHPQALQDCEQNLGPVEDDGIIRRQGGAEQAGHDLLVVPPLTTVAQFLVVVQVIEGLGDPPRHLGGRVFGEGNGHDAVEDLRRHPFIGEIILRMPCAREVPAGADGPRDDACHQGGGLAGAGARFEHNRPVEDRLRQPTRLKIASAGRGLPRHRPAAFFACAGRRHICLNGESSAMDSRASSNRRLMPGSPNRHAALTRHHRHASPSPLPSTLLNLGKRTPSSQLSRITRAAGFIVSATSWPTSTIGPCLSLAGSLNEMYRPVVPSPPART